MPENVKTRPRAGTRRATTPDLDTPTPEAEMSTTETAETVVALDEHAPDGGGGATVTAEGATDPTADAGAGAVVGWADAVPWLALRWGSAPSATEVRFAPVVWAMLHDQPQHHQPGTAGRTVLQMAAAAELAGHDELDPTILTRVLARYERAGVVRQSTDGRLARWSVLDPAEVITHAQDTAKASTSTTPTRSTASRTGGTVTPAGGLRGLVAAHMAAHPADDFSPSQVANALGRSSGAVANALERLTEHGTAVQTSAAPRRYQHHDPAQDGAGQDGAGQDGRDLGQAS